MNPPDNYVYPGFLNIVSQSIEAILMAEATGTLLKMHFVKEFQCSHALSFAVIIDSRKLLSKVVLYLNT